MKKIIVVIAGILLGTILIGCTAKEDAGEVSLFSKKLVVGTDIAFDNITDFYYTEENINYNAYYQRYRFFVEDGKHLFFHETRERKEEYGPCTEEDTIQIGTIELSDDQWSEFTALVKGGIVTAREESADSGDSGPWLYLYWTNDKSKYQQFSFESYGIEAKFEEFCLSLAPKPNSDDTMAEGNNTGGKKATISFDSFDGGGPEFNVVIADDGIVSYISESKYRNPDHEKLHGAGYDVIISFIGIKPGETTVVIEERSPIADNLDHKYRISVDDELNVQIEQLSVRDINEEAGEGMILKIDGEEYPVEWEDNESVEALKELCPLTIEMSMYGGFEQVGSIGKSLPKNDKQTTTDFGDIVLYSGDQIVVFYGSNSWAYTKLGRILADKEIMEEALGNGNVTIELVNE